MNAVSGTLHEGNSMSDGNNPVFRAIV